VGLKRKQPTHPYEPPSPPQSNQRGIETLLEHSSWMQAGEGLNRTSVGLKLGIAPDFATPVWRLNRTSVGLKL